MPTTSLPAHAHCDHTADPATPATSDLVARPEPTAPTDERVGPARTPAEIKLWAALAARPGSTGPALAAAAGIGRSTAAKVLARWASDHTAARTPAPADGGGAGRTAERWTLAHPIPRSDTVDDQDSVGDAAGAAGTAAPASVSPAPAPVRALEASERGDPGERDRAQIAVASPPENDHTTVVTDPARADRSTRERAGRLPAGGLRGLVEDYLREHPDDAFGPSQIGKHLARSGGAVANALVTLVETGYAELVQDTPRRYRLTPTEDTAADPTHAAG